MVGRPEDRSGWRPFIGEACAAVGVDPALVDENVVLRLAADIAHRSGRPMAPVGAFVLGVAVGQHADADPADLADRLRASFDRAHNADPADRLRASLDSAHNADPADRLRASLDSAHNEEDH